MSAVHDRKPRAPFRADYSFPGDSARRKAQNPHRHVLGSPDTALAWTCRRWTLCRRGASRLQVPTSMYQAGSWGISDWPPTDTA